MTQDAITRRQTLTGTAALLALSAVTAPAHAAPAPSIPKTASGRVFDADGGGGIAGVMVSNGRDVELSDPDGRWRLPVADGDSIFVIKPPGWMTPLDAGTMLPHYSYVHAPTGTPDSLKLRFNGLDATGAMPDSIDFALRRAEEPAHFDVLLFTDPQPESLAELGFVRDDVVAQLGSAAGAFGITHGDVMFDDLSFYERSNRITGSIGVPWYYVPGNHDMNLEAPDDRYSRETFKRVFGARYSALQYAGATFLLLDNVQYLGTDQTRPNGSGKYRGYFGERQLQFVRNVLAHVPAEALVVLSFHIPLRTAVGSDPSIATVDVPDFLAAIATHRNSISFAGHTHTNEHHYLTEADGFASGGTHHHHVLAAVSGSWWSGPFDERGIPVALQSDGCPNGFHILSVNGATTSTRFVPAHDPQGSQLRLVLDSQVHRGDREVLREYRPGALLHGPVARAALHATRLLANLYDGGPRSAVTVAFGASGQYIPMTRTARTDPFVEEVYARNAETKKPWVQPGVSTHLWQIQLPDALTAGTHRLTVRATDEFGSVHVAGMVLEVV